MDRKSIVLCLSILAVLVLGTGIAVAFLYSDVDSDRDRKTTGTVDPEKDWLHVFRKRDCLIQEWLFRFIIPASFFLCMCMRLAPHLRNLQKMLPG